ncbi:MAG: DUF2933 domain-containing protein [Ktedonobacterales bacterium]|nr:DUF2933 domain-containing protein [Ktedonobacterales bacterium]
MKIGSMCLNWKVVAALAAVGVGIWLVAPGVFGVALPLLFLAICPLSMLLMMRGMGSMGNMGNMGGTSTMGGTEAPASLPLVSSREERLADLRGQLARIQAEQDVLAREIATLGRAEAPFTQKPAARVQAAGEPVPGGVSGA